MKTLRTVVFAIMAAAVSLGATQVSAQEEVNPDHYEQPVAAKKVVKTSSYQASAQHHPQGKTNLASKHAKQRRHATA